MVSPAFSAAGILLCVSGLLHAQTTDPMFSDWDESVFTATDREYLEPLPDPEAPPTVELADDWAEEECVEQSGGWLFAVDFTSATFELQDDRGRYWIDDPVPVSRFEIAYEFGPGVGTRVESWWLNEQFRFESGEAFWARAGAWYWDVYRRYWFEHGELTVGGGLAVNHLRIMSPYAGFSRYTGVGASAVAEGFFPLVGFKNADLGVIGHARLGMVAPFEDDFGADHAVLIDDIGVGLEFRRRFGKKQDRYWFLSLAREYQHWTEVTTPLSIDQEFQGTSLRLGLSW